MDQHDYRGLNSSECVGGWCFVVVEVEGRGFVAVEVEGWGFVEVEVEARSFVAVSAAFQGNQFKATGNLWASLPCQR